MYTYIQEIPSHITKLLLQHQQNPNMESTPVRDCSQTDMRRDLRSFKECSEARKVQSSLNQKRRNVRVQACDLTGDFSKGAYHNRCSTHSSLQ